MNLASDHVGETKTFREWTEYSYDYNLAISYGNRRAFVIMRNSEMHLTELNDYYVEVEATRLIDPRPGDVFFVYKDSKFKLVLWKDANLMELQHVFDEVEVVGIRKTYVGIMDPYQKKQLLEKK